MILGKGGKNAQKARKIGKQKKQGIKKSKDWRVREPKKVKFANFAGRNPELVPQPPFVGVPEPIPDSFLESSRTSLSSVWFAGNTAKNAISLEHSNLDLQNSLQK